MRRSILLGFLMLSPVLYCVTIGTDFASAQQPSLWQRRDARIMNLYSDIKARNPGDLLYVLIKEGTKFQSTDKKDIGNESSSSSDANGTYGLGGGLGAAAGNLGFDQGSAASRDFKSDLKYTSDRIFTDNFTVTVVDTTPSGNLLISGRRSIAVEGDNRTLVLSGVVRGVDVGPNNTISSELVGNLVVGYETDPKGSVERRFLHQGWLGKKMNRLWPY